jgi:hypothetical protein
MDASVTKNTAPAPGSDDLRSAAPAHGSCLLSGKKRAASI